MKAFDSLEKKEQKELIHQAAVEAFDLEELFEVEEDDAFGETRFLINLPTRQILASCVDDEWDRDGENVIGYFIELSTTVLVG